MPTTTPQSAEMSLFQSYIFKSRYARWLPEESRREDWPETVRRYMSFILERIPEEHRGIGPELEDAILRMEVMPSMRAMMTAGRALVKDEIAGYNCAYMAIDDPRCFDEAMYISMCGVGLGFSVERQYIKCLPTIAESFYDEDTVIKVRDSKIGWATGFRQLIALLYGGLVPRWDLSLVRPAGSILKTFGGRASGPEPLGRLFKFTVELFRGAAGRKLTSIECHDLMCMVADIVVSGGVRRSAMISLSNLSDDRMRNAKNGQWWIENQQRALANNSAVYTEKPEMVVFMREWLSLCESRSGERGIYNREAATKKVASLGGRRKFKDIDFGLNPCGEIILRSKGLCNLTEVIVRPEDTEEGLMRKVRLASILGTLQATLTRFRYLRKDWQNNAEEERLLGVGLGGIMDNPLTSTNGPDLAGLLDRLRGHAVAVNAEWAEKIGIPPSAAVTCNKPSGTVSHLVHCSPGIHGSHSPFCMMAIREDRKNPVASFLKATGVPHEPDVTKPGDVDVFFFPVSSPRGSRMRDSMTAVEQLEMYLTYRLHWTEHNPSCTIYVRDHEWLEVGAWVHKHFDQVGGVAFLPHTNHIYQQAPYTEITEGQYREASAKMPHLDWSRLSEFEKDDRTTAMKEIACSNGMCEL